MHGDVTKRGGRRWHAAAAALACALLALASGCVAGHVGSVLLVISLRTDFVPAEDFEHVRVDVTTTDGLRVSRDEIGADQAADYIEGVRLREAAVPPGPYIVEVSLVGRGGGSTARRRVAVEATMPGPHAITVVVTRASVECDESSCPEGQTCGPSGCVDLHCAPETPESCSTDCRTPSDCPPAAACASAACASGTCLYGSTEGACGDGELCDPSEGCIPRTTPVGDVGTECEADTDCDEGVCIETGGDEGACTTRCDGPTDCMSGWTCGPDAGATGDVCLCTVAGPEICSGIDEDCDGYVDEDGVCAADVGTPCASDEVCASRTCIDVDVERGVCSMACRTSGDCAAGWSCGLPAGETARVCLCSASVETCNEEDDDCDGDVDELGVCGTTGPSCVQEVCNLADDDCDGYCDDGTSCRRPVHRAFNPTTFQHLYTISTIEITSRPALTFEAQDYFQLYIAAQPGLAPLHRCYWPDEGSHLYSTRADCEGAMNEGVIGFVATTQVCGSVPLFELRSRIDRRDYLYTVSGPEREDVLEEGEVRDWGIVGYVWLSDSTCTDPAPEDCGNGRDDDCDGRVDCDDYECCASGECSGIRTPGAYRIRCCRGGWVNIARSEKHCGGCNTACQGDFQCYPDREGSGHCDCTAGMPDCPRGQQCVEQIAPGNDMLGYRCSCTSGDQCANTFVCRTQAPMDNMHNICHPTR